MTSVVKRLLAVTVVGSAAVAGAVFAQAPPPATPAVPPAAPPPPVASPAAPPALVSPAAPPALVSPAAPPAGLLPEGLPDPTGLPPGDPSGREPGEFPTIPMLTGIPVFPMVKPVGPPLELAGNAEEHLGWEASLAAREQAIVRAQDALRNEMTRLEDLQKKVESRWTDAMDARRFAEEACGTAVLTAGPATGVLGLPPEEREAKLELVATILKKMKPQVAADLVLTWDDALAIRALERLPARVASPILSKMPPEAAGRLTRRMATGQVTFPVGVPR